MSTVDCVMTAQDLPIAARSGLGHAKRTLRVALDVSILKHGSAADSRRSGLFRVTEGLVTALAHHPHCDLVLLVRVPKEILERSESLIVLPGEIR